MSEDEARSWIEARFGSDRLASLTRFVAMVNAENTRHNLIAPSTVDRIWSRHVVDSAQLAGLVPAGCSWLDIGTGGGFPGLVIALIRPAVTHLVEPRRLRAAFLRHGCDMFGMTDRVTVHANSIERVDPIGAAVISARAVAAPEKLLRAARHCATTATHWLLPSGRTERDLTLLERENPDKTFHVERSITDPESTILIGKPR